MKNNRALKKIQGGLAENNDRSFKNIQGGFAEKILVF